MAYELADTKGDGNRYESLVEVAAGRSNIQSRDVDDWDADARSDREQAKKHRDQLVLLEVP